MDRQFHLERRATPDDKLHILHERWFSVKLDNWIEKMKKIEIKHTLMRHGIHDTYHYNLFDESRKCQIAGMPVEARAKLTTTMNVDVETSAQLTIIGNLGDLSSLRQSHLTMRNSGALKVRVDFEAYAELRFVDLERELVGRLPVSSVSEEEQMRRV
jgi:chitinase